MTQCLIGGLGILFVIGILGAIYYWKRLESFLLMSGLLLFLPPSILSARGDHPLRLIGIIPFLALLVGLGTIFFLKAMYRIQRVSLGYGVLILFIIISPLWTHFRFQAYFQDPDALNPPREWTNIPHNYSIAYYDALELLAKIEIPTYVPLSAVDNPLASFILQREAFPNVTTWSRYGLENLPQGQIFYPERRFFHGFLRESDPLQVLLLPEEDTIVILPPMRITRPMDGKIIMNDREYIIARTRPQDAQALPEVELVNATLPEFQTGLQLVNPPPVITQAISNTISLTLLWQVNASQATDVYSISRIINQDFQSVAGTTNHVLEFLYPSSRWQAGDIIPDVHEITLSEGLSDEIYRFGIGTYIPPNQTPDMIDNLGFLNPINNLWLMGVLSPEGIISQSIPEEITPTNVLIDENIEMVGYQITKQEQQWIIDLYWKTHVTPQYDAVIFVHVMQGDTVLAQADGIPNNGQLPTWQWIADEIMHTQTILSINAEPDLINIGMVHPSSQLRLPIQQNGNRVTDDILTLWKAP